MSSWHGGRLSRAQSELVQCWLPDVALVRDHSWGLIDSTVLEVAAKGFRYIVKAAGPTNHHIGREITAHETATRPLASIGCAPRLVAAERTQNILVTEFLTGELVEGASAERAPETYVQAGRLLRAFHDQARRIDDEADAAATAKAVAWLEQPNRIDPDAAARARDILGAYRPGSEALVPTHGDWQPRNWLVDGTRIRVIDFGRFDHRPAMSDLSRLAAQQWREDEGLEAAFLDGYGSDPRNPERWRILMLREAIATAAWAYSVGDEPFERQGHRMVAEALAAF